MSIEVGTASDTYRCCGTDDLVGQTMKAEMKLLTVREVAASIGRTERQIYHWTDTGFLPCIRVGASKFINEETLFVVLKDAEKRPPGDDA